MKKVVSMAALLAVLTGCMTNQDSGVYGSESMSEESLAGGTPSLNDSTAPATNNPAAEFKTTAFLFGPF